MYITRFLSIAAGVAVMIGSVACNRRNEAKERVQAEREKWEASLPDSLEKVKRQTDSIQNDMQALTRQLDDLLPEFKYVDNPREVEGYYIAGAWAPSYPLKTTGVVARLTKSDKLELIAALSGGAHFDRLRVTSGDRVAETSAVAHDQALNYRMEGLNTVCFSDSASNACAELIADGDDITIAYLEGDRQTGKLVYPKNSQAVMALTWRLFSTRSELLRDERMIPMLAKKGAIISAKIDAIKDSEK